MAELICSNETGIACYYAPAAGPCILWLHGYTMNASVWKTTWEYFSDHSNLAIDLPGHGGSYPIAQVKDLTSFAKQMIGIAAKYDVKYIVGLSFGGLIALQMAIESPDGFDGLFLNSSPFGGGPIDLQAQTKNLELIKLYKQRIPKSALTEVWMKSPPDIFKGAEKHCELWKLLKSIIEKHTWEELADNSFSLLTAHEQTKTDLSSIRFPVHLFIGEDDMQDIKRCAEIIRRGIKKTTRFYVPDAGHLALLENPKLVSAKMKELIKSEI